MRTTGRSEGIGPIASRYLWIVPLALALWLFFPSEQFQVGGDGWRYMARAIGLAEGRGYIDIDWSPLTYRGPLYPLWMAVFFRLLGHDVAIGYLATRLFWPLGALIVYLLAARWFSRPAGLVASLLVLTSSSLAAWSDEVHVDYPIAVMLLASIAALAWALERDGGSRYPLAGLVLGTAYLFKQTAILLIPLPLLAVLGCPRYRTRRRLVGAALHLGAFLLLVGPWWFNVWRITGDVSVFGGGAAATSSSWFLDAARGGRLDAFGSLGRYYRENLAANFGLAPLFLVGWAGTAASALRGRCWARVLGAAAICLLPLLILQGQVGYRVQQSMIFHLVSYFALVGWGWSVWRFLRSRLASRPHTATAMACGLAASVVLLQIGAEEGRWLGYVGSHQPWVYVRKSSEELDPIRQRHRVLAEWLLQNVPEGTAILGSKSPVGAVAYYSQGRFPIYPMPREVRHSIALTRGDENVTGSPGCEGADANPGRPRPRVLYMWLGSPSREEGMGTVEVSALVEQRVLGTIRGRGAKYLILTRNDEFMLPYFQASSHFRIIGAVSHPRLRLVEVLSTGPAAFEMRVEERLPRFMRSLRTDDPHQYRRLVDCFLGEQLGLSAERVERIVRGDYRTFRFERHDWLLPERLRHAGREEVPE